MRRIFITPQVEQLAIDYRDNLFSKRNKNFNTPKDNLRSFEDEIRINGVKWSPRWKDYADYVHQIIELFPKIIVLKPSEFETYRNDNFSMLTLDEVKSKSWKPNNNQTFSDRIVELMRYKDVRSKEIIPYIEKLGIRTCVYCNSQYTVTTHVDDKEVKGGYQLDHFFPKDKYPFLCISFFNLQPSCGCCNNWKSENTGMFNLYSENWQKDTINPFRFSLTNSSMIEYMLKQDSHSLEIHFDSDNKVLLANHEELFHISKLYENFKEEAEELIWKKKTSNEVFYKQMTVMFGKVFPNLKGHLNRFLYGFYDQEKDIHRRPLTKMKQDIARQLELIK